MLQNLFEGIPTELPEELIETLFANDRVRIERIVSRGEGSPEGFWYDQETEEFVLVLKGRAGIRFADRAGIVELGPGDFLEIGAHVRHRVEWSAASEDTIWLAVHY